MLIGLHVKYLLFLSDFIETQIFLCIFKKYSNIEVHENLSSRIQVVSYRQTDRLEKAHSCLLQFCECTYKLDVRKQRTERD
jgi:hypothetical protein